MSNSSIKPNFTMTPNYVFDTVFPELSGNQSKVFMLIIRHTTGWNQTVTKINQKDLAKLGNITRQTVKSSTEYLAKRNLIEVYGNKKIGLSYSYKLELKEFNYNFQTLDQMLKNLTSKKDIQMLKNLTSDVKNFNIPYILNTSINTSIKKYIKKNTPKSSPKSKKTTKPKKQTEELGTVEIFEEFKSKFEFINFEDFKRLVSKLQDLNSSVTKKRIVQNLKKLEFNKGRSQAFTSQQFALSVDAFCKQDKYQGVWVVDRVEKANNATPQTAAEKLKALKAKMRAGANVEIIDAEIEEAS